MHTKSNFINYFFQMIAALYVFTSCTQSRIPIYESAPTPPLVYVEPVLPPPKIASPLIVIDPGHGGEDKGTLSLSKPSYQEKFLTLTTSKLLKDYLQKMGYQVKLTRTEDVFIPLSTRAKIANEAKADFFVSIHYNSAPSAEAHGIEIFYYKSETDLARNKASKDFASCVLGEIIPLSQAKSRGVKAGNFAVIRETKMPAILIEGGFLTNTQELEKIKDPQYVKQLAWGIAQGIHLFIKN